MIMNNKIITTALLILTAAVGFLLVQNIKLSNKVDEMTASKEVAITPVTPNIKPAGLPAVSPFDKPNVDPLANQFPAESGKMPELTAIKFDRTIHDFGKIYEGELVRTVFRFENTGKNPLIISNAQGSCGCTVPKWPQHPVPPGGMDEIAVEFNSAGKMGQNEKTVTVTSNTNPATIVLTVKATVVPKDK